MCHYTRVAAGGPSSHKDHFKACSVQSPESSVSYVLYNIHLCSVSYMMYLCGPWNGLCSAKNLFQLHYLYYFLPIYAIVGQWSSHRRTQMFSAVFR